ncbi:DUF3040 domain-containing protein [Streptomyces tubbatahanensis]|uniref:DUF3040 domain-containing protein n=1 Tax=Streptomyces tubbatahanensis TaxID=2923272 RepID=A0ABY3Y390_9ACTN|nr:DUF3040 domain-containing protein [Streptomyces tubbatahanensis]UNT00699.1 DUF3040 domain-containing protein [Streptomyces tubbatahanensis]
MAGRHGNGVLDEMDARMRSEDPRFAHAMDSGRPCRPREYRRGCAWSSLAVGVVLLGLGVVISDGILITSGLVVAGAAGHLFDPERRRPGRSGTGQARRNGPRSF